MSMEKEFTKSDLENGMVIEERGGKRKIVFDDNLLGLSGFNFLKNIKMI